jgi:hypothetical protein
MSSAGNTTAADLAFCVADVNRYRAMANRPALTESAALETFASTSALADAASGVAHSHFTSINGGGISAAENELLSSPLSFSPTPKDAISNLDGISWAEGPGGGHYQNLTGGYTQVGCGTFTTAGAITVAIEFR